MALVDLENPGVAPVEKATVALDEEHLIDRMHASAQSGAPTLRVASAVPQIAEKQSGIYLEHYLIAAVWALSVAAGGAAFTVLFG